eukprot:CAMPEP_0114493554 /NCGR_PEP_ID=MMETSP0109-20121206/4170_1 /TAXON_ID=29199 /ORGANISM="Chlorarachnion reptans, Strain CCCM449" /LENGTH=358 /DNA_ID=CAMNT_0001670511 /DNA_START=35 /DNA_END=1111 /DNA_ORIENTATION=-
MPAPPLSSLVLCSIVFVFVSRPSAAFSLGHLHAHRATTEGIPPWSCDEITPGMCSDLSQMTGTVSVRNLSVRYWVYTARKGPESGKLPLVVVHGGPAFTHNYLLPLKQQACRGREVIFYDQAGCGDSQRVANVTKDAPWLLTVKYYVEELETVVSHLGVEKFHLLGNSWGGMLVMLYALSKFNERIVSLIVSGGLSDTQFYIHAQEEYLHTTLPVPTQRFMEEIRKTGRYDDPKYQDLVKHLTGMWTIRTYPWPTCYVKCHEKQNVEIYALMQGDDEFTAGGVLSHVNFTEHLRRINVPVLMTHGRFDTMTASQQENMAKEIRGVKVIEYEHSGHLTMIDDAGKFNDDVATFMLINEK